MSNLIKEIKSRQDEIIRTVNIMFEEIIRDVSKVEGARDGEENDFEITYSLTNTKLFKSQKVIAVLLDGDRVVAPTWKVAVSEIMERVMEDVDNLNKLYNLRGRLLGRTRTRIASTPKDMRSPLKLAEKLFIETHYDTETLMNFLLQILNSISYDYSKIEVVIKR